MRLKALRYWTTKDGKRRKIRRYNSYTDARYRLGYTGSFEDWCETYRYQGRVNFHSRRKVKFSGWRTKDGKLRTIRLYRVWGCMHHRCSEKARPHERRYYYDKGIRVCREWHDYRTFHAWAAANGYGKGLTIDRIDSDKGYSPENCEWITPAENARRAVKVREANRT